MTYKMYSVINEVKVWALTLGQKYSTDGNTKEDKRDEDE